MSTDELKAVTRQIVEEAWNRGNLTIFDKYYTPGYVRHKPPFPDIDGLQAAKQFIADSRSSYPDLHVTVHEVIAEGNKVVSRWTFEGTQVGQSPTTGVSATGKKIAFSGCNVAHWENDKIVEEWEYSDWLVLLQQFGVVPPPK
jgi:predicted ester cyclase